MLVVLKSEKKKKEKEKEKRSTPHFVTFPPSLLQFSFFSSQFSPLFPFFLASFFPGMSAEIFPVRSLGGALCPQPPAPTNRLLRHCPKLLLETRLEGRQKTKRYTCQKMDGLHKTRGMTNDI